MPSHPRVLLLAALCALASCRVAEPESVVEGHHELCCKSANPDNHGFVGCRASSSCRTSERVWVRGPVTCAPPDAQRCAGGRCCELDLGAVALLGLDAEVRFDDARARAEPPPTPAPELTNDPGNDSGNDPGNDPDRERAPEPAPIVPVPLDWQARPTAVSIPKILCPATVERGVVGSVELHVEVDASGRVTEVSIRSGIDPQCDELARDALLHAEFEPALTPDGRAIASSTTWVYEFTTEPRPTRDGGG
jgi:TonB family protein